MNQEASSVNAMRRTILFLVTLSLTACSGTDTTTEPETTTTAAPATTSTEATTTSESAETTAAPTSPTLSISIAGFNFSGDETGSLGDTVQVTNSDNVGHTWTETEGAFHSGVLSSGDSFTFTFDQPGTYDYFCQIHPEMTGTITIEG